MYVWRVPLYAWKCVSQEAVQHGVFIFLHMDSVSVNFLYFIFLWEWDSSHTFQHMHNSRGNFSNCWGFRSVHPLHSQDSAGGWSSSFAPLVWHKFCYIYISAVHSPGKKITEQNESTKTWTRQLTAIIVDRQKDRGSGLFHVRATTKHYIGGKRKKENTGFPRRSWRAKNKNPDLAFLMPGCNWRLTSCEKERAEPSPQRH